MQCAFRNREAFSSPSGVRDGKPFSGVGECSRQRDLAPYVYGATEMECSRVACGYTGVGRGSLIFCGWAAVKFDSACFPSLILDRGRGTSVQGLADGFAGCDLPGIVVA